MAASPEATGAETRERMAAGWHKMKDEAEELLLLVSSKLPGKMIIWLTASIALLVISVLGRHVSDL